MIHTNGIEYKKLKFNQKDIVAIMGTNALKNDYRDWSPSSNDIKEMALVVRLNTDCNFDCKYCGMHDYEKFTQDPEIIKNHLKIFIDKIFNIHTTEPNKYERIGYYFYGGEPTKYKFFENIIKFINEYHNKLNYQYLIEVQTNMTRPISFFQKMKENGINIKFICSYQNTEQQQIPDYQNRYKKISEYLVKNSLAIGFDIMLEDPESHFYKNEDRKPIPNDLEDLAYFYKKLMLKYNNFSFQTNTIDNKEVPQIYKHIYNEFGSISEKVKLVRKTNNRLIEETVLYNDILSENYANFFGFTCEVGLRQLLIQFSVKDVKMFKCFSDTFYNYDKPIYNSAIDLNFGEIISNNLKPIRCLHKKCSCEVYIKKYKNSKYIEAITYEK